MTDRPAPSFRAAFDRTLRFSLYVSRVTGARPAMVAELEARGARGWSRDEMRAELGPGEDLGDRLRRLRARVMVSLAHRDLNGLATLDEVVSTMTALAEESIEAAAGEAHRRMVAIHGEPASGARLIIAALGKLGGRELNVSSDVDLVFLHAEDGETSGPRVVNHTAFYAACGRALIALLAEITAEGQAFRVDMRLRPFGDSGPPVASLASLESYFVAHARPWERYAWMKARVVAGEPEALRGLVEPFVYRRYLDFGMLDALRDVHGRIAAAAQQRGKSDDIKVGAGGIRELEFAVQLFQLVRGGREAGLRTPSTREALAAIGERGLMDAGRVRDLGAAYDFLRRLEHRLQYYDDQQTQALPRQPEHQTVIAESMGMHDYPALLAELERHRDAVKAAFHGLFEQSEAPRDTPATRLTATLYDPQAAPDPELLAEQLTEAGIVDAAPVARRLIDYTRSRGYRSISTGARAKVEKLVPALVAATAAQGGSETVAGRLIDLLEAIDRREVYFSLLAEYPQVLERVARLSARSAWAARLLARHPILLDELTRPPGSYQATDWEAERQALAAEAAEMRDDVERMLDHLRHYKQRQVLRFTIADIEGELPVMVLSDELSALADVLLDVTLLEAQASLGSSGPGLCVVGYGKLGGKELGFGSDLDIIFVYDDALAPQAERLARVAQRVNHWMTTLTPAGVLYDVDLRLRPDGLKGMMVSPLAAFRDYQQKRAWTWEHQALTRARACAGDRATGAAFERMRDDLLAQARDRAKLFEDILAMRRKMRAEHRADASDIKHIEGGIIDLEFSVQALVLTHGPQHPMLRENKGNHTLLKRAGSLGLIDERVAVDAADAYLAMRKRSHAAALNDEDKVRLGAGELEAERAAVKELWRRVFTP
ncbi:MAG TPA: bifunctional [glutamate--ammonia ligase]-adenylyl-L-tyrosine phosphorylase/[glutamate--ammonia-ligase] adenylyltransferase [Usitatibacter sp.]|nr:bifunctional [glutamate--ammonia ligase]-adenylyl-L-tyrosine phosphorylase/[glutamate--ammonia-ligase] adenylyltransferase [Usitatibacter sp.]